MATKKKMPAFEEGMVTLDAIITQLSQGGLSLDESMKTYEEGMKLVRELEQTLARHRRRIEQIDLETAEITTFEEKENDVQ